MKTVEQKDLAQALENQGDDSIYLEVKDLSNYKFKKGQAFTKVMSTRLATTKLDWVNLNKETQDYYSLKRPNDIIKMKAGETLPEKDWKVFKHPQHENSFILYLDNCTLADLEDGVMKSAIIAYRDTYLKKGRFLKLDGTIVLNDKMEIYLERNKKFEIKLSDLNKGTYVKAPVAVTAKNYLSGLRKNGWKK